MNIKNCVRMVASKCLVSEYELKSKFEDVSDFEPIMFRMVNSGLVELHENDSKGRLVTLTTKGSMYNRADVL